MKIRIEETESKGFAVAEENGTTAGKMTYSLAGENLLIIDHTEVEPAFKGMGVGKKLLYEIVNLARSRNSKILPLCPFASAMFKKLDDIQDVLKP